MNGTLQRHWSSERYVTRCADWQATYGNDSLDGGVAKQRFACAAKVTLPNIHDDDEDDEDGRMMQLTVVLSITAAAAAACQADISIDWLGHTHSHQLDKFLLYIRTEWLNNIWASAC